MRNPTVSIIIPCYNSESTIAETLESLQKQTFEDWEAIVVNDGSTDGSSDTVCRLGAKDPRIQQINQENQGPSGARNAGLEMARGKFVNFLDADDLLLPSMLQKTVWELSKNTSLGAVRCGWILSDPELQDFTWTLSPSREEQLFRKLAHYNMIPLHSVLLHRETIEHVGVFDYSLRICEDWDLWLRVARAGTRFGCVPEPLVVYRMVPVSNSRNALAFFEAQKEVILRGHRSDPRVKNPINEFADGCECSMKEAILGCLISSVGFAIAKGDAIQASKLLETGLSEDDPQITPSKMRAMVHSLWFGAAVPKGNWEQLWSRVGYTLLQFLLRQEERLRDPGFAMQSILEMLDWHELQRKSDPGQMYGRELLSALQKKIVKRYFRLPASHKA